ncbi:MAG: hypothetical protein DVS81_16435 [Candidatus Accumulibacter meliphilus]|uniref:Uncharacterized protein n=1 Tax=Candidatus Accumulibacter meliphilus TaxID=2211374 RepID=A0A369XH73_9PROT|nr:MAG: hypothetical protein DVS81_16435 [Candidatus Accumulibacter meliphilus]
MSFQALLAARAHTDGRALPTAIRRHRALSDDPLCIVAWQLGAEAYSVGAIAIGRKSSGFKLFVPGYPLNRDLLFAALVGFAKEFCPAFEDFAGGPCEDILHHGAELAVPLELPQIVVPNAQTIGLLGRLGRRLAYLPTTGPHPADPLLPCLGRHLMWIADHAQMPGQQLIVSATDLLTTHYASAMSAIEMQSLPAMDAWIDPPAGMHGFNAAELAEIHAVGPVPSPRDGELVHSLMHTFNDQRAGSTDPGVVDKLVWPLRAHYRSMVDQTWNLMWKVVAREKPKPEAASVVRRVREDRIAFAAHLQWMAGPAEGRRKTRMTARGAAMRLHDLEQAHARLLAEEAIDDPLRMAPHLLAGKALAGVVIDCDKTHRELINSRKCLRPRVIVRTQEPCLMLPGAKVWWTQMPDGREWLLGSVIAASGGSDVTLILQTNRVSDVCLPIVGSRACFSQFNTRPGYELFLPQQAPWTHLAAAPPFPVDLDYSELGEQAA